MKRVVCAAALFLLAAVPVFALQTNLIDDVIRMSKSGVADETIIEYVRTSREQLSVTADDVLAMQSAGVSQQVIKAVIERGGANQAPNPPAESQPQATSPEPSPQAATSDNGECVTFEPPVSLWWPYYGTLIPPQLWDPYWYQPRLDTKSGAPVRRAGGVAGVRGFLPRPPSTAERPDKGQPNAPSAGREHSAPVARERIESAPRERVSPSRSSGSARSSRSR